MNIRYVLNQSDEDNMSETRSEFYAVDLEEICDHFTRFLRGCGFEFEGNIGVVNDLSNDTDDWLDYDFDQETSDDEFDDDDEKCSICKMTKMQMDGHICFDKSCPFQTDD